MVQTYWLIYILSQIWAQHFYILCVFWPNLASTILKKAKLSRINGKYVMNKPERVIMLRYNHCVEGI